MALTAIGDKVIATMVDGFGEKTTSGGLIIQEKDGVAESVRPRWFHVTHVGPEQTDVKAGEYVLVAHGRWTRGIEVEGIGKVYRLDNEELLAVSDTLPNSF